VNDAVSFLWRWELAGHPRDAEAWRIVHDDGRDYRRLARQIRDLARQTRLMVARNELLRLATNYTRRGDHLDRRTCF
jgi:hypothetical protein